MNVRLLSPALEEFNASCEFYAAESIMAAGRFIDEIESAIEEIGEYPIRYPVYKGEIRMKILKDFPFTLIYSIEENEVLILSVMHQSRLPDFWKSRRR